jgi:hypothetical protein
VSAAGGAVAGLRRLDPLAVLAAGTVAFFWLTMLMPGAPHHDGARLFIVVFPFLGMLAGYGLYLAWRMVDGWLRAAVFVLGLGPAAVQLAWIHPYELAYYSEIVGGVRGAKALGLETTYWMDTYTGPTLAWMNDSLPPGADVFVFGDPLGLQFQQGWGGLRPDLNLGARREEAGWALVQMRQGLMDPALAELVRTGRPAHRVELQGVPLVAIYRVGSPTPAPEDGPR